MTRLRDGETPDESHAARNAAMLSGLQEADDDEDDQEECDDDGE